PLAAAVATKGPAVVVAGLLSSVRRKFHVLRDVGAPVTVISASSSLPVPLSVDSGALALRRCAPRWRRRLPPGPNRGEVLSCALDHAAPFGLRPAQAEPASPPAPFRTRSGGSSVEASASHRPAGAARVPHAGRMGAAR